MSNTAVPVGEPSVPSLVALIFAKRSLGADAWDQLNASISLSLQENLRLHTALSKRPLRFLETDEDGASRVAELTIPLILETASSDPSLEHIRTPLTLIECATLCNSPPIQALQTELGVELVLQPSELYVLHQTPGLAVFDMDSTLIQQEVIDELARAVGLYDKVAAITEAAMRGEAPYTDFEASLRARVGYLRGVPFSIWDTLKASTITFTPGALELAHLLKASGWKTAVLSGGFIPLATWVKETLGLDYAYANHLINDDVNGVLTGELVPEQPIIHAQKKRELLLELAKTNNIPPENCIAVGDGSNDLLMMGVAGLGVAFNAKPKVQLAAPTRLNSTSLLDVGFILGKTRQEMDDILSKDSFSNGVKSA